MTEKLKNRCERCNDFLDPKKEVWLTYDQRTNTFTDLEIPEQYSQGGFPFGRACARRALKEHQLVQENLV
jgi:hypothetical protein